ncbi:MAG: TonB-dependent receptor [Calditrichia bacterium]
MSKKRLFLCTLSILLFAINVFAGTTGKIMGVITDAETGDPLIGVNIVINGTSLGAATDADGTYVILNVPPGLYTVTISYLGYQSVEVKNVRVNVDFTARVNQTLKASSLEMSAVEVVGERNPLVRADLTNTQVAITSEKLDELPVDQINDVISLQAGVVVDNSGNIHIRGGRSDEISYQINGLSINNPFGNSQGVGISPNAVEEVSVSAGTFSAEYGNALSGVINFVTKDGGSRYDASLKAWSGDYFSSHSNVFPNIDAIDPLNYKRVEWTLGGPVPLFGNKLTFFASGVGLQDNGYLYGIRVYNPEDLMTLQGDQILIDPGGFSFSPGPNNTILISADPSRAGASGDGSWVPMVTRKDLNLTGKLTWKPNNRISLTYDLIYDNGVHQNRLANGINVFRRFRFTPDGTPKTWSINASHSFGITHTLSKKTFYTLKLGVNFNKATTALYKDATDLRYVPSYGNDIINQMIQPTDYVAGGSDLNRAEEYSTTYLAKLDVASQVLRNHELKFGGEFAYHRLENENYVMLFESIAPNQGRFIIPTPEQNPNFVDYQNYSPEPVQGAFYVLDKMELASQFIFNIGLRYEYFNARSRYNPDLAGTVDEGVSQPQFLKSTKPKQRVMPRLSFSFPITSQGIIRFSYGIFYQYPILRKIYRNLRFEDYSFIQTPSFGNANLEPERSVQYELGLQQQFTSDIKMDLTAFYKDVNNLIDDRRVIAGEVAVDKEFNVYTNIGYAKIKGFTVAFLKRRSARGLLSASLDYTFQVGMGSYTDPLALAVDTRTGRSTAQKLVPLDFDRTHTIKSTLTLSKANNWSISAIGSLESGTPYTPSVPSSIQPITFDVNSSRRPWIKNLDLKLEKFFHLSNMRFSIFMNVDNVFDTKNELLIHTDTGHSLSSLEEATNPTLFDNLRGTIASQPNDFFPVKYLNDFYQREDYLSSPRLIRWGMTFMF